MGISAQKAKAPAATSIVPFRCTPSRSAGSPPVWLITSNWVKVKATVTLNLVDRLDRRLSGCSHMIGTHCMHPLFLRGSGPIGCSHPKSALVNTHADIVWHTDHCPPPKLSGSACTASKGGSTIGPNPATLPSSPAVLLTALQFRHCHSEQWV
jgi:hypothetical protein